MARHVGLGLGVVRLRFSSRAQLDAATLAAAGVDCGVGDFDVALGIDFDLTALCGRASRRAVLGGRHVDATLQLYAASGLDAQCTALAGCAQVDAAGAALRELRGLHLKRAAALRGRTRGRDGAGVDDFRCAQFNLAGGPPFCSRRGVGGDGAGVLNLFAGRQDDATALLLQATGLQAAAVFDHTADEAVHGLGAQDDQAAGRLHGMAVVHQGLNLRGLDADAGQAVIGVKFQLHRFTRGQGYGAHVGNDGALVAHFGRQERDVTAQSGFEFALVDHAAGATVALKAVFTSHEVGVAQGLGGGHQAAHIDPGVFAKVHARRVGQDHLAVGGDAPEYLARVRTHHAVERDAGGAGLLELHLRVFAHVEALPVDGGTITALLDDHVCAAGVDAGLTSTDLAAGG